MNIILIKTGVPRLTRPPRPGPCLDFGFQYALIRNNQPKKIGVEHRTLTSSNSRWRPCLVCLIWSLGSNLTCMNSCQALMFDLRYSRRVLNNQQFHGIYRKACRKTLPKSRLQSSYQFLCYVQPMYLKKKIHWTFRIKRMKQLST